MAAVPPDPKHPSDPDSEPDGLGRAEVLVITLLSLLAGGLLFLAAKEPLDAQRAGWLADTRGLVSEDRQGVPIGDLGAEGATDPAAHSADEGGAGPQGRERSRSIESSPQPPSWSLIQVSEAVKTTAPALQTLIEEGRDEIRQFDERDGRNAQRAARAQRQWQSWGRIWLNRVAVVEKRLPPPEACAVHAAMDPACGWIRAALETARGLPETESTEAAEDLLDLAAGRLDNYLNPPEPEEPETPTDGELPPTDEDSANGQGPVG